MRGPGVRFQPPPLSLAIYLRRGKTKVPGTFALSDYDKQGTILVLSERATNVTKRDGERITKIMRDLFRLQLHL